MLSALVLAGAAMQPQEPAVERVNAPAMATQVAQREGSSRAFEKLKALVGEWNGRRADGRPLGLAYRLSAGGTVLVETWALGPGRESLTLYHLHDGTLMATHYCPQGNQPRLTMRRASDGRFEFALHDATDVQAGEGVQHAFWIELGADGTVTRSETYVQDGEASTEAATFTRGPAP